MNIAVIGGSGFIGKQLVKKLCQEAHEVRVLDNRDDGAAIPLHATISHCDITNYQETLKAVNGADAVVHLVGTVLNVARKNPHLAIELDGFGLANVLEACVNSRVPKVVYASSFYVYDGLPASQEVSEETQTNIFSAEMFGAVKMMGEKLVYEYSRLHGLEYVVLRFGAAYGPDPRCTCVVYDFIRDGLRGLPLVVWGKGARRNQYTHVSDIANASASALEQSNEVFNIISSENVSLREVAEALSRDHGFKVQYDTSKHEAPSLPYISPSRAIRELNWEPMTLREGVYRTIEAMRRGTMKKPVITENI
jgi:UDP-glucose 4-epimerase